MKGGAPLMIRLTTPQGKPILVNARHVICALPHEGPTGELTEIFMQGPRRIFVRETFHRFEELTAKEGRTVAGTPL